jgi:formamidopyrimidine-DNA glycosylase
MPELPEVETLRRDLARRLPGERLGRLWTSGKPLRLGRALDTRAIAAVTVGHSVTGVRRLAKYLLVDTDGGGALLVHLGMTGHLVVAAAGAARPPHTHLAWALDRGRELRFVDPRRFGQVTTVRAGAEAEHPDLAHLGVEPLGPTFTAARLAELLEATDRPLKAFLLDQTRVAGLGNIYVSEALFLARLHPSLPSARAVPAALALRTAIRAVLAAAVKNRGTTIRDYTDTDGREGANQHSLKVYGREGQPCRVCRTPIVRQVDGGRSTFFCPSCQANRSKGTAARSNRRKGR